MKLEFVRQISGKNTQISNLMKIRPEEAELFHENGREKANTKFSAILEMRQINVNTFCHESLMYPVQSFSQHQIVWWQRQFQPHVTFSSPGTPSFRHNCGWRFSLTLTHGLSCNAFLSYRRAPTEFHSPELRNVRICEKLISVPSICFVKDITGLVIQQSWTFLKPDWTTTCNMKDARSRNCAQQYRKVLTRGDVSMFNPSSTKLDLSELKIHFVPRGKHSLPRL